MADGMVSPQLAVMADELRLSIPRPFVPQPSAYQLYT